jgi:hypothetical protein
MPGHMDHLLGHPMPSGAMPPHLQAGPYFKSPLDSHPHHQVNLCTLRKSPLAMTPLNLDLFACCYFRGSCVDARDHCVQTMEGVHRAGVFRAGEGGKVRNRLGVMAHHFEAGA